MALSAREQADLRKRTCIRCLNGQHASCTAPKTCAHFLCENVQFKDALEVTREKSRHQRPTVSPSPTRVPPARPRPRDERPKEMIPMSPLPPEQRSAPDGMVWEEPPVQKRGSKRITQAQITALRGYPGQWARTKTFKNKSTATSAASQCRQKNEAGPGIWEFVGREIEPVTVGGEEHTGGLYARFLGADEEEAEQTRAAG